MACYHLSWKLLSVGRLDEARHFYRLGEKTTKFRTEKDKERYESLRVELFEDRLTGTISYVPENKAYGFIERDDAPGQTIFVHRTAFVPNVSSSELQNLQGARVSFTIEETADGLQARNVRLL